MARKILTESQIENLIELVSELKLKLKRKNEQLTLSRRRLNKAKNNIKRLQGIISYQRERILDLHRSDDSEANKTFLEDVLRETQI